MKFDYCLGNPPYQETKGGTKNVDIWPNFVLGTSKISKNRCFVHPGKWVIPKTNSKKIQEQLLNDGLAIFEYFPQSEKIFNNVSIDGGISITIFKEGFTDKPHYIIDGIDKGIFNPTKQIFSSKFEEEAYNKVFQNIDLNMSKYIYGLIGTLGGSDKFNYLDDESQKYLKDNSDNITEPIKVWATKTSGKGSARYKWYWIEKEKIKNIAEYQFKTRKVMLDKKGHAISHGKGNVINNIPQICDKYTYGVNVLWVIPKHDIDRELELIKSLFITKTARYLMCITQKSLYVMGFENIPDYVELAKLLPENELFTDQWFYKTFNFSQDLINEIETRVSEKVDR